jgi:hypothetical protein
LHKPIKFNIANMDKEAIFLDVKLHSQLAAPLYLGATARNALRFKG